MLNSNSFIRLFTIFSNLKYTNRKILSPLIEKYYPTASLLDGWFVTGLTEAEGVFNVVMYLDSRTKGKDPIKRFRLSFAIAMKNEDQLLVELYKYFGCGNTSKNNKGMTVYTVQDISSLYNIIWLRPPHFNKYPLQGTKHLDFLDFSKIAEIMFNKQHLTVEGFKQVMDHYLQMNTKRNNFMNSGPHSSKGHNLSIESWRKIDFKYLTLN